jgi:RHS repeat-associated protein
LVGKRLIAVTGTNSGLVSAFTADRLQSKGNGSNYYPYGESKTSTAGDDREGFATYTRDEKSGLDYADQRWYASGVSIFTTPDPFVPSASLNDPASQNRYSYTRGNPVNRTDESGLLDSGAGGFRGPAVLGPSSSGSYEVPWDCNIYYHNFGINGVSARELFGERCGGWGTNSLNEMVTMRAFEERGDGGGGGGTQVDPCDGFKNRLDDAINKGQRYKPNGTPYYSHEKSLVQRALEQIFGTEEKWATHQTVIDSLRSEISRLVKKMGDNNCPDPPKKDIEQLLELTSNDSLQAIREAVNGAALAYMGYRAFRLLPSLLPPFWPTLVPNLVLP